MTSLLVTYAIIPHRKCIFTHRKCVAVLKLSEVKGRLGTGKLHWRGACHNLGTLMQTEAIMCPLHVNDLSATVTWQESL